RGNHHGQIDGLHGAREVVVGGIMRQVSELEQRHLAYVYAHRDRLQKRLKENLEEEVEFMADSKAIKEQLQQMMDKN
ncbi:MAG: hypothetical protein J7647_32720, partial [Cyanobacteria bacterium SBLK]|nr:hypothetical protein [Cyanobacteria bacterium SBLK]